MELYNLVRDPLELDNLAEREAAVVALLQGRMEAWIARREQETEHPNPVFTNLNWHGTQHQGPFTTSQQAYETLHIGSVGAANRLQAGQAGEPARKQSARRSRSRSPPRLGQPGRRRGRAVGTPGGEAEGAGPPAEQHGADGR
ncbi:MAG: hypothetical protein AB1505_26475 [Candidatus Latescibacterota bacterium]